MCTHSQLLLEALDLDLHRIGVLRLSLTGRVAGVSQLGQTTQSLFQPLNICQQLCDLKQQNKYIDFSKQKRIKIWSLESTTI